MGSGERFFLGVVAVAVTAVLAVDAVAESHGLRVLAFPGAVGTVVLVLCILRLWHLRRNRHGAGEPTMPTATLGRSAYAAAGLVAALPMVMVFGLAIGLPAYVAAYVRLRGESWRAAALAAAVTLAAVLLFVEFLGMPLPEAPLAWP